MHSKIAISVLGLHELEEADGSGVVLAERDRREAGLAEGLMEAAADDSRRVQEEALERRTRRLLRDSRVAACVEEITQGANRSLKGRWLVAGLIVLALTAGFLTNEMSAGKVINLLSLPMLGLLVWNFFVYIIVIVMELRRHHTPLSHGVAGWLNRWLLRGIGVKVDGSPANEARPSAHEGAAAIVLQARRRFWEKWVHVVRAEAMEWTELAFHSGAIAFALGLTAGMYARGLSAEYKAAWESTFLNAAQVSQVVKVALGPASVVMRTPLPGPEEMQGLNIHEQEKIEPAVRESGAKWINLYAVTALLFIGLPRAGLAWVAWRRLRRLRTHAPVDAELRFIFRDLVRRLDGGGVPVLLLPFCHELSSARQAAVHTLTRRLWPDVGEVEVLPVVPYGGEDEALETLTWPALPPSAMAKPKPLRAAALPRLMVLMSMSATPEDEVHGHLLRVLASRLPQGAGGEDGLLAVALDTEPFRGQLSALPERERRLRERRAAWERVIESSLHAAISEHEGFYVWRCVGR